MPKRQSVSSSTNAHREGARQYVFGTQRVLDLCWKRYYKYKCIANIDMDAACDDQIDEYRCIHVAS